MNGSSGGSAGVGNGDHREGVLEGSSGGSLMSPDSPRPPFWLLFHLLTAAYFPTPLESILIDNEYTPSYIADPMLRVESKPLYFFACLAARIVLLFPQLIKNHSFSPFRLTTSHLVVIRNDKKSKMFFIPFFAFDFFFFFHVALLCNWFSSLSCISFVAFCFGLFAGPPCFSISPLPHTPPARNPASPPLPSASKARSIHRYTDVSFFFFFLRALLTNYIHSKCSWYRLVLPIIISLSTSSINQDNNNIV